MQLSFSSITVDYYPFHKAGKLLKQNRFNNLLNRKMFRLLKIMSFFLSGEGCLHWMHYSEATKSRETWARSLLEEFKSNVDMLKNVVTGQSQGSPQHGENVLPINTH